MSSDDFVMVERPSHILPLDRPNRSKSRVISKTLQKPSTTQQIDPPISKLERGNNSALTFHILNLDFQPLIDYLTTNYTHQTPALDQNSTAPTRATSIIVGMGNTTNELWTQSLLHYLRKRVANPRIRNLRITYTLAPGSEFMCEGSPYGIERVERQFCAVLKDSAYKRELRLVLKAFEEGVDRRLGRGEEVEEEIEDVVFEIAGMSLSVEGVDD